MNKASVFYGDGVGEDSYYVIKTQLPDDGTPAGERYLVINVIKVEDGEGFLVEMFIRGTLNNHKIGEFYTNNYANIANLVYPLVRLRQIPMLEATGKTSP
jgi:hypothetical protein